MHVLRNFFIIGIIALISGVVAVTAVKAAWNPYCSSCTFYRDSIHEAGSGYANWTANRVYRPIGHPFFLLYNNGTLHYSTDNWNDNPFSWAPFGYSALGCKWDTVAEYWTYSVSPVSCQGFN